MLSQDEEHQLAVRLQKHNDLDAAKQMVLAHTKYVVRVAKSYMGYGLRWRTLSDVCGALD
jgi:RNA polymerase sigma-32 factor